MDSRIMVSCSAVFAGLFFGLVTPAQTTSPSAPAATVPEGYAAPSRPVPSGRAPGMRVQLLSGANDPGKATEKTYAVIFSKGDEALSGLNDFARQYHVEAARFTAIGALSGATLAWFDPKLKLYKLIPVESQVEVVSMVGDIAFYKGQPFVHSHLLAGLSDGATRGGHLLEAHVNPTLEVLVTVEPGAMHRRFDPESGFSIIDPRFQQQESSTH